MKYLNRQILAVMLTTLLCGNCFGKSPRTLSPREQVRAIGGSRLVEVKFLDGSKLRGLIGEVSDTGFVLSHERKKQLERSQLSFDKISAVREARRSHEGRNIAIAAGVGGALVAVGIVILVKGLRDLRSMSSGHWFGLH